jgi:hypothetical protein
MLLVRWDRFIEAVDTWIGAIVHDGLRYCFIHEVMILVL